MTSPQTVPDRSRLMGSPTSSIDPNLATWQHCLEVAVLSDIGMRRGNNQDSYAVALASNQQQFIERGHLFIVADGMGAHAAGELASKLGATSVPLSYHKFLDRSPPEALRAAVEDANAQIHSRGQASDDFKGMGTTMTSLLLLPQGAVLAQVGDSRGYRLRGNRLEQLTFDHSLVWELRATGQIKEGVPSYIPKNIITRSLGPNPTVQVDIEGPFPLEPGDTFLLCSDGLSGQVKDEEIGKILSCLTPDQAVRALVDLANLRGGPDNSTIIIARVTGPLVAESKGPPATVRARRGPRQPIPTAVWTTLLILMLVAGAFFAMNIPVAGAAALLGAFGAAAYAAFLQFGGKPVYKFDTRPLGKAPYTVFNCTVDGAFIGQLAGVSQQLRDAAAGSNWTVDWATFNEHERLAAAANQSGRLADAVREYCLAITSMMDQLRQQRTRKPPSNDSVLG
jgi:PPM family protein phosphatase